MTVATTTVTPVEENTQAESDGLSAKLSSRRATRKVKQEHRQAALRERIEHQGEIARIMRGGNARALKLQSTKKLIIRSLLPALLAFGAWSTAGVQAGAAAMTGAEDGDAMWWALWALEPALIVIVAVVVVVQSQVTGDESKAVKERLEAAGRIMWGALGVSLILNTVGHWPSDWAGAGGLLFHALGPIGAAATVHLIGVLLEAVESVPIPAKEPAQKSAQESPQEPAQEFRESTPEPAAIDRSRLSERALEIPAGATRLAVVRCCSEPRRKKVQKPARSTSDQAERPTQKPTPAGSRKARSDKGVKVPEAAKKAPETPSPRRLSDLDLVLLMEERIDSRELSESPTVKAVQESVGVGFERAKRLLALYQERTETVLPGQLSVVDETPETTPELTSETTSEEVAA